MARHKPKWRKVLTGRFLRWWFTVKAVRLFPSLGRLLGFFPDGVDMIAAADTVLADEHTRVSPESLEPDLDYLRRSLEHDSVDPAISLPDGVLTGARTVLIDRPWVDVGSGALLLPDTAQTVSLRGQMNWNASSIAFNRKRVPIPSRVFAPINTSHYYHLLLENGVRLLDLLDSGKIADRPLTIVKTPDRTRVETALYQGICGLFPEVEVRQFHASTLVLPEQAVCHFPRNLHWEWPPLDRSSADRLAEAFTAIYGAPELTYPPNLFLSRGNAKLRGLENEDNLIAALSSLDFATFVASDMNHPEQIARFQAAKTVVAVHGAGLTNLVFCRPGTKVIEIFPSNFVKSPFWWICRCLGLEHHAVLGGQGDYDQRFSLDANAIAKVVNVAG